MLSRVSQSVKRDVLTVCTTSQLVEQDVLTEVAGTGAAGVWGHVWRICQAPKTTAAARLPAHGRVLIQSKTCSDMTDSFSRSPLRDSL